jgi:nickel transport protein
MNLLRSPHITVATLLLASVTVHAHDYWFESAGDDYLLHRGHRFSQHSGSKEVPFEANIVTGAYCLRQGDSQPRPAATSRSYPLRVHGPCQAVMVTADSGYWSQTLTGTTNRPKDKAFGALRSWHAIESVKRLESWDERLSRPFADELELTLAENPFLLRAGDKLRLTATLGGKPAKGVTVAYDGDPRGVTGSDGRINVRLRHAGLQVITASLEESLDSGKADKRVRSTILLFEIK